MAEKRATVKVEVDCAVEDVLSLLQVLRDWDFDTGGGNHILIAVEGLKVAEIEDVFARVKPSFDQVVRLPRPGG